MERHAEGVVRKGGFGRPGPSLLIPDRGERLGHAKVSMTMEVYAHVLPDMQQEAAAALGSLLHG